MTVIAGNLVVIKDGDIVFSRHMSKPNNMSTLIGWEDFIHWEDGRFTIPVGYESMWSLSSRVFNDDSGKAKTDPGPMAVQLCDGGASEFYLERGKEGPRHMSIPLTRGSVYVRSRSFGVESAASAASIIYSENAYKIYRAAMRACGIARTPVYIGSVKDICRGVKKMQSQMAKAIELMETLKEMDKDPSMTKKQMKKTLDAFNHEVRINSENLSGAEEMLNLIRMD